MYLSKKAFWRSKIPKKKHLHDLQLDYAGKCTFSPPVNRQSPMYGRECGASPTVKGTGYCPEHRQLVREWGEQDSNFWPD